LHPSTDEHLVLDESGGEEQLGFRCTHRDLGVNSTMTTTDSGIGSIANRATRERRSRSDSRLLGSRGLAELPVAVVHTMSGDGGTVGDQMNVSLRWHVSYCGALIMVSFYRSRGITIIYSACLGERNDTLQNSEVSFG